MDIQALVRPNIANLKPYSSARNEFTGEASVFLDANENPYGAPLNRYPDPLQIELKERIAQLVGLSGPDRIFLGNGSDEAIDLVYRVFCVPGSDNVVAIDPSYGMYEVCAEINHVDYRRVSLRADFSLDADKLLEAADDHTKVIFLCSPNNPTGNLMRLDDVLTVLDAFHGIVVVDEAYIDFADAPSLLSRLDDYPHLIVLRTFSKAWGHAAIRLGMAFSSPAVIDYFNKVKYPYNVNRLTQQCALELLSPERIRQYHDTVSLLKSQRAWLIEALKALPIVSEVFPTDANFILVRVDDADLRYAQLRDAGIIVRNRTRVALCKNCLRITVGTVDENRALIAKLKEVSQ